MMDIFRIFRYYKVQGTGPREFDQNSIRPVNSIRPSDDCIAKSIHVGRVNRINVDFPICGGSDSNILQKQMYSQNLKPLATNKCNC